MIAVKILGLSGTPIEGGNCDTMVKESLKACVKVGNVETEFVTLANKEVVTCKHCQWCIENMAPCKIKDDALLVFNKIEESDGLILGSPTWANTLSPFLPSLFSRARYHAFFTHRFRNKPVGTLTLGFLGFGLDNTLSVMRDIIAALTMIPVAMARASVSSRAFGKRPEYLERGVLDDSFGILQAQQVGYRVVEVARMIKYATENGITIPDDFKYTITGGRVKSRSEKNLVQGVWREKA